MDSVGIFNEELQSLLEIKPPVSKAKMGLITRAAMKGVKFYKHIVQSTEKFILRCRPEYKVPGLYVIDSIVRQSRHQFGIERDVYAARFSRNLPITFRNLFVGCLPEDKPKIVRVLNLWQKNGVFNSVLIQPLLDMSNLDTIPPIDSNSLSATSPTGSIDNHMKQGQSSKFGLVESSKPLNAAGRHQKSSERGLKFSKNMLDFDYDEDDEEDGDETPTEAEPPLSSTLNRIEMEQRGQAKTEIIVGNDELAYQSSQPQAINQATNQSMLTGQDPVLERWNRLIRQQSITSEPPTEYRKFVNEVRARGSRSRSPQLRLSEHDRHSERSETKRPRTQESDEIAQKSTSSTLRNAEREADRKRKCLPKIRDKHVTVCSSTLWLGHVPKTVSEADISDAFGEYGSIASIDLIPPRGCAYVCMDRRQDAKRALSESRNLKLNGSHIKMAWAPGKGFKQYTKLKDFWESDTGSSFIPYYKIDESIDFDLLEEGGVIDEDSMSMDMRERRERKAKEKNNPPTRVSQASLNLPAPSLPILTQPPPPTSMSHFTVPPPNLAIPPPPTALGHGVIPFPPPGIPTSLMNHMPPQPTINHQQDLSEHKEHINIDDSKTPDIDQQISMTEQQISMVEQQLNFMQHAQGFHQQHLHQQVMFQHGPPINPMMFDMHQQAQLIHNAQQMLNPQQLAMFPNQPLLGHPPPMPPVSQTGMTDNSSTNEHAMLHQKNRY